MRINVTTTAANILSGQSGSANIPTSYLLKLLSTAAEAIVLEIRDAAGSLAAATTGNGFQLDPGETIGIELLPGEVLSARSLTTTIALHVLRSG